MWKDADSDSIPKNKSDPGSPANGDHFVYQISGVRFRVSDSGYKVSGKRFRATDFGYQISSIRFGAAPQGS